MSVACPTKHLTSRLSFEWNQKNTWETQVSDVDQTWVVELRPSFQNRMVVTMVTGRVTSYETIWPVNVSITTKVTKNAMYWRDSSHHGSRKGQLLWESVAPVYMCVLVLGHTKSICGFSGPLMSYLQFWVNFYVLRYTHVAIWSNILYQWCSQGFLGFLETNVQLAHTLPSFSVLQIWVVPGIWSGWDWLHVYTCSVMLFYEVTSLSCVCRIKWKILCAQV